MDKRPKIIIIKYKSMKKVVEFIKNLYKNNKVKTACWTIANAVIVISVAGMTELNAFWVAPMIAILNMATKIINNKYL